LPKTEAEAVRTSVAITSNPSVAISPSAKATMAPGRRLLNNSDSGSVNKDHKPNSTTGKTSAARGHNMLTTEVAACPATFAGKTMWWMTGVATT
jgi:hypothetical protein